MRGLRKPGLRSWGIQTGMMCQLLHFFFHRTFPPARRRGKRLGPASAARSSTRSTAGPSLGPGSGAAGQAQPRTVLATASWTATERAPHQRLAQPEDAAARTAGGARRARSRTRSRTKPCAAVFQRPPISEPRTRSFCGPPLASSGYVQCLRRSATLSAAPSTSTVQGCG